MFYDTVIKEMTQKFIYLEKDIFDSDTEIEISSLYENNSIKIDLS